MDKVNRIRNGWELAFTLLDKLVGFQRYIIMPLGISIHPS